MSEKNQDTPCVSKISTKEMDEAIFPGRLPREELRVLLKPGAHAAMKAHAKTSLDAEVCGVMLGVPKKDAQGPFLLIEDIIEGQAAQGAEAKVTFTPEAWDLIFKEQEKRDPDLKMVGWYHTHPRFGIFLSRYDQFIHENFFAVEPWMVAFVIDPVQDEEGFFAWHKGKTKRVQRYWIGDQPRNSDGAEFDGREFKDDHSVEEPVRAPVAPASPPAGGAPGPAAGPVAPPIQPWHQDPITLGLIAFVGILLLGYMGLSFLRGDPEVARLNAQMREVILYQGALSAELRDIKRQQGLKPSTDPALEALNEKYYRTLRDLMKRANQNNPIVNPKDPPKRPGDGKAPGKPGDGKAPGNDKPADKQPGSMPPGDTKPIEDVKQPAEPVGPPKPGGGQ